MTPCVLYLSTVHDASAKLPAGLLNGNVNQYGDIDQCLQVRSPWQGPVIKGRYCLTTMALRLSDPHHPLLRHIHQLLQSHYLVRSELDDVSRPTGCQTHRQLYNHLECLKVCLLHHTVQCRPVGWWEHTVSHARSQLASRRRTFAAT